MACDDVVLAQTTNPKAYAKSLLSLAERVGLGKGIALAQAALGRAHQTSKRIVQILDAGRPKATRVWKPALGLVTAMSAVAIMAVQYTPNLISFDDQKLSPVSQSANASVPAVATPVALIKESASIRAIRGENAAPKKQTAITAQAKRPNRNPIAMQAGLKQTQAPEMLVVMRTVQYDESGISVWTLCVWQVSNNKAAQKQLHPEQAANSL